MIEHVGPNRRQRGVISTVRLKLACASAKGDMVLTSQRGHFGPISSLANGVVVSLPEFMKRYHAAQGYSPVAKTIAAVGHY